MPAAAGGEDEGTQPACKELGINTLLALALLNVSAVKFLADFARRLSIPVGFRRSASAVFTFRRSVPIDSEISGRDGVVFAADKANSFQVGVGGRERDAAARGFHPCGSVM